MTFCPVETPWGDLDRPPLRPDRLRAALVRPDGPLGRIEVLGRVGSTNAELAAAARSAPHQWPDLSVLVAEHQVDGRGRLGRSWSVPPQAALTFSVLLRPIGVPPPHRGWLPLVTGLSVVRVVRAVAGLPVVLKWPNDVLTAEGRKLAGVLIESDGDSAVVGIGLNVSQRAEELPVPHATSLAVAGAAGTDRDTYLRAVLRELAATVDLWRRHSGDAEASGLAAQVREVCVTVGRDVRVERPGGDVIEGVADGIGSDARLLVTDGAGTHPVAAGDVVHAPLGGQPPDEETG